MDHPITNYREKFRLQYRFSPERNFTNDPCGSTLVFPTPFGGGIRVFACGGPATLERLRVHRLGSVWHQA